MDYNTIRKKLLLWYDKNRRDLPWRRTRDPYAIWISEIMLQQTRVTAVIPYWERFLLRFPNVGSLSRASEEEVLALWSGLGYYSRARNLQNAAREIARGTGTFPKDYDSIRKLTGIGEYTAAAVASIAFGLPYPVVDGNVRRVVMRLQGNTEVDVQREADQLLDRRDPGRSNQALMELGALVCLPRQPLCGTCPVEAYCHAHQAGTECSIPPARVRPVTTRVTITLLLIRRRQQVLLCPSPRVKGFWELPEPGTPGLGNAFRTGKKLGSFRHAIMNCLYTFEVCEASSNRLRKNGDRQPFSPMATENDQRDSTAKKESVPIFPQPVRGAAPNRLKWWCTKKLDEIPLSTAARKALSVLA